MYDSIETITVGEVVAADFRTAAIFQSFGIDFCCGGKRSLAAACKAATTDPGALRQALESLPRKEAAVDDLTLWPLNRLTSHIVFTHHAYIRSSGPAITRYLEKLVKVHGARHPELARIERTFGQMLRELEPHMMKEEHILFPYLEELARDSAEQPAPCPFGTVHNPIRMMENEHEEAGAQMRLIRELTNDFTPPADGCTTYKVCFAELERFEADLHRHVHLENNILFPKAVAREAAACPR
jgi:regulator of cell morphogenesis and NO signaling